MTQNPRIIEKATQYYIATKVPKFKKIIGLQYIRHGRKIKKSVKPAMNQVVSISIVGGIEVKSSDVINS